jgi:hypothetical protein
MLVFKKWLGWLFNKRSNGHDSDHPDINTLNFDELKTDLRVKEEAERLGKLGVPAQTDTELTHIELRIWQRIEAARSDYQKWATTRLKLIHDRMISCDITKLVNRSLEYANEFRRNANRLINNDLAELNRLQQVAAGKKAHLDQFRIDNKLSRPAREVSGLRKTIFVLMAILLVALEGVLNAGFFAQGLDGGLIEGFSNAVVLALCNVVVALFLGYKLAPLKNHVSPAKQFWGWFSIALAIAMVVLIALVSDDLELLEVSRLTLESLKAHWFSLRDIFSYLLFGVTCFFGALAWCEGYNWRDTYPGYGDVQSDAGQAIAEYEDRLSAMRAELEELKDECLHKLEADIDEAKHSVLAFKTQVDRKEKSRYRLKLAIGKAEDILVALVGEFRTNNYICLREIGLDKPAYFNEPVAVKEIEWPDFSTEEDVVNLEKQEQMLRELLANLEKIRAEIQSSFDSTFDQIKPIRDQIQ